MSIVLAGCDYFQGQEGKASNRGGEPRAERPAHAVEVVTVSRRNVSLTRSLTGTLEAPRTVHIHSEQAGRIIELPFYEGDSVRSGVVLARLDDALHRAELAKAVALRKQAEVDHQRLENLVPRNLASADELARANTAVELARAEESLRRTLLSRTVIKAPFDGVVSARIKEPSDIVAANDHILTLFDPSVMTIAVQVPEQLHSRVKLGGTVDVRIDSLGDRRFAARIIRIHPAVDPETRQGTVEIQFDSVPENARTGQLGRVTLQTEETPRLLIPMDALQFDSAGSFVYRLGNDSKVVRNPVTIGLQIGASMEIIDGIDEGERIVSRGFLGLKQGKAVRVVDPSAGASGIATGQAGSQG